MLWTWYRKRIQNFLFRKLLFWVSLSLVLVFLTLGFITQYIFYNLLENKEQQLLTIQTEKFGERLADSIHRFNEAVTTFYTEDVLYDNELIPKYKFLDKIHITEDNSLQFVQQNYFISMLNMIKKSSLDVDNLLIYRTADNTMFSNTNRIYRQFDRTFDFKVFFESFQLGRKYPFFGNYPGFINSLEGNNSPYIISPIYRIESNYNPIIGYLLMTFNAESLIKIFHANDQEKSRIFVMHQDKIWLDSHSESPIPDDTAQNYIHHTIQLEEFDIKIFAFKDKQVIQANLSAILVFTIFTLGFAVVICVFLIANLQRLTVRRLIKLGKYFYKVQNNPLIEPMDVVGGDEISHLVLQFNSMTEQLRKHIQSVYIAEIQKRNAEYNSLKMQVNPHFLFNTLESIRMLAVIHNQPIISEKLHHMGHLYRWILKTSQETIPIEEEIRYTEYFVNLSSMGFSNSIRLIVNTEFDLRSYQILKLSLQPICENAIKHGQLDLLDDPQIRIEIYRKAESLFISVSNNGVGLTKLEIQRVQTHINSSNISQENHIGLRNINQRIRIYYGNQYGLVVNNTLISEGFGVTINLPLQPKEKP